MTAIADVETIFFAASAFFTPDLLTESEESDDSFHTSELTAETVSDHTPTDGRTGSATTPTNSYKTASTVRRVLKFRDSSGKSPTKGTTGGTSGSSGSDASVTTRPPNPPKLVMPTPLRTSLPPPPPRVNPAPGGKRKLVPWWANNPEILAQAQREREEERQKEKEQQQRQKEKEQKESQKEKEQPVVEFNIGQPFRPRNVPHFIRNKSSAAGSGAATTVAGSSGAGNIASEVTVRYPKGLRPFGQPEKESEDDVTVRYPKRRRRVPSESESEDDVTVRYPRPRRRIPSASQETELAADEAGEGMEFDEGEQKIFLGRKFYRFLKRNTGLRVSMAANAAGSAVMDYLVSRLLNVACRSARSEKRKYIQAKDIRIGIRSDRNLGKLLRKVIVPRLTYKL